MPNLESPVLGLADKPCAYTLNDSIAEKLRSLSQQVIRNRTRREDIFDLMLLVDKYPDLDEAEKQGILNSLIQKSESRGITPNQESLDDSEIRQRMQKDYHTLADAILDRLLPTATKIQLKGESMRKKQAITNLA